MEIDKNFLRLTHILKSIEKIEIIAQELSYGQYLEDWIKQDAIIRNFEIIGEASKHIDEDFKLSYSDVPWKYASGMRNYLIHEYFNVDYDEVWKTLKKDLPSLKLQIQQILKNLEKK